MIQYVRIYNTAHTTVRHPIIEEAGWPLSPTAEIHPAHTQCNDHSQRWIQLMVIVYCVLAAKWHSRRHCTGGDEYGVGIVLKSNMTTTIIEAFLTDLCYRKPWVVNHARCLAAIILSRLIKLTMIWCSTCPNNDGRELLLWQQLPGETLLPWQCMWLPTTIVKNLVQNLCCMYMHPGSLEWPQLLSSLIYSPSIISVSWFSIETIIEEWPMISPVTCVS